MQVNSFDDLSICYLGEVEMGIVNTKDRRKFLEERYNFRCECTKCQDVYSDLFKSSMICKKCQGCVPSVTGICTKCNEKVNQSFINKFLVEKKNIKQKLKEIHNLFDERSIDKLIIETIDNKIFHPYDEDFTKLLMLCMEKLDYILDNQGKMKSEKRVKIGRLLIINQEHNFRKCDPNLGIMHSNMVLWCYNAKLFDETEFHINEANRIYEVAFDEDSKEMKAWRESGKDRLLINQKLARNSRKRN